MKAQTKPFRIDIKGEFPATIHDFHAGLDFQDFAVKYKSIEMTCTKEDLDAFLVKCYKDESRFKVIGVHDLTKTLIEIEFFETTETVVFFRVFDAYLDKKQEEIRVATMSEVVNLILSDPDSKEDEVVRFMNNGRSVFRTWISKDLFTQFLKNENRN